MRSFLLWNPLFAFVVLAIATVACGDLAEQPANPESEESSFTVDEYRLYRSVIDTPLSIPEDQVMQNAAEEYGVTIQDANLIAEKVLLVLLTNSWFGRPEAEIRRASDWQGETK